MVGRPGSACGHSVTIQDGVTDLWTKHTVLIRLPPCNSATSPFPDPRRNFIPSRKATHVDREDPWPSWQRSRGHFSRSAISRQQSRSSESSASPRSYNSLIRTRWRDTHARTRASQTLLARLRKLIERLNRRGARPSNLGATMNGAMERGPMAPPWTVLAFRRQQLWINKVYHRDLNPRATCAHRTRTPPAHHRLRILRRPRDPVVMRAGHRVSLYPRKATAGARACHLPRHRDFWMRFHLRNLWDESDDGPKGTRSWACHITSHRHRTMPPRSSVARHRLPQVRDAIRA